MDFRPRCGAHCHQDKSQGYVAAVHTILARNHALVVVRL